MCGIFGVLSTVDGHDTNSAVAQMVLCGLHALQHRGQDAAGAAVVQRSTGNCSFHHGQGLVPTVFFDYGITERLVGSCGVGHVRYPTRGGLHMSSAQPFVLHTQQGQIALCHNGEVTNNEQLRRELLKTVGFRSTSDTEVLAQFLAAAGERTPEQRILDLMERSPAAYSVVIATSHFLLAFRDPLGVRPLSLGRDAAAETFFVASESCAITAVGGSFMRDIAPGEVIRINWDGTRSSLFYQYPAHVLRPLADKQPAAPAVTVTVTEADAAAAAAEPTTAAATPGEPAVDHTKPAKRRYRIAPCIFEYVYFSRPDSMLWGQQVHEVRRRIGAQLAADFPPAASVQVIAGVPDSGTPIALGFAHACGIPYDHVFARNRYVGRSFIKPDKSSRDLAVRLKFQPIRSVVEGKSVLIVDDTVVRGTTLPHLVRLLKEVGAREVHVRIAAPPVIHECNMGIDLKKPNEMISNRMSQEELRRFVDATSLEFLSLESLVSVCGPKHCTACFSGHYPANNLHLEDIEDTVPAKRT